MSAVPGSIGRAYVEEFFKATEQWRKALDSASGPIEEARRGFAELVNGLIPDLKFLQDMVRRDREAKRVEALNSFLEDQGWFVPPILDEEEQEAVAEMVESGNTPDTIIQHLMEWCARGGGREIVETASSNWAFSGREALLKQAFEAHERGKYALSIPVFLSQAEGAFIGGLVSFGFNSENKPGLFKRDMPPEIVNLSGNLYLTEIVLHAHLCSFSGTLSSQLTASVWTEADLKDLRTTYPRGYLSRHGVMHGIDTGYASPENGVKALFVVDVLREFFDYFQTGDGQDG